MTEIGRTGSGQAPALVAARPGGPVLIHALSGLGKTTLARAHPSRVIDADTFLYEAVALGFPELEPRARLRAWHELCGGPPYLIGEEGRQRWVVVRRGFVKPLVAAMMGGTHSLVVTSLLDPPWFVSAYYGVARGQHLDHVYLAGRQADNGQSEAINDRLEGYLPLVRVPAGTFLSMRLEVLAVIRRSDGGG